MSLFLMDNQGQISLVEVLGLFLHHLDHLQARKLNLPVLLNRVHKHQDLNQLLSDPSNNLDLMIQLLKKMLLQQNGFIQAHGIGIALDSILLASITHALKDNILCIFQQAAISIYIWLINMEIMSVQSAVGTLGGHINSVLMPHAENTEYYSF